MEDSNVKGTDSLETYPSRIGGSQNTVESQALEQLGRSPAEARTFLTEYGIAWGDKVVQKYWKLGDALWTRYDEKFQNYPNRLLNP